jgi:hypothetical protein
MAPTARFFLIGWLKPQRNQRRISFAAPAPSKADEAVNWLRVDTGSPIRRIAKSAAASDFCREKPCGPVGFNVKVSRNTGLFQ